MNKEDVHYSSYKKCDGCGEIKEKKDLTLYVHKVTKDLCPSCYEAEKKINNPDNNNE